jgi:uncharacterized membrane protein YeaQ/YmgE (transglycosylase-associated protein family)
MNAFLIWMGVGAATGLLASLLLSHMQAGTIGSIVIGMVGAVLAGLLLGFVRIPIPGGLFAQAGVAFVGAVLLLGAVQQL